MSRKLVRHERIASQSNRFHVSYSFVYDGYFAYVRYPAWWTRLFGWMVKLAGKLPYERINHAPFDDEHQAWIALEEHCLRHEDWNGVGYARAMRKELCFLDGRPYYHAEVYGRHVWINPPSWVNELYLTSDQPMAEKKPTTAQTPRFVYTLKRVDIDGSHIYEVYLLKSWEETFGRDFGKNTRAAVDPAKVFEPGQLASGVQPPQALPATVQTHWENHHIVRTPTGNSHLSPEHEQLIDEIMNRSEPILAAPLPELWENIITKSDSDIKPPAGKPNIVRKS